MANINTLQTHDIVLIAGFDILVLPLTRDDREL